MAGTFPVLESGAVCKYPVTLRSGWSTKVNQFVDFSEQRWVTRQPLIKLVFEYRNLSRADINTLKVFVETQLGEYDTFSVPFDGYQYDNMVFDQDDFRPIEDKEPNRFSVTLKMRQMRPNGWFNAPIDVVGSTPNYPFITGVVATVSPITYGVITQRPWTGGERYFTNKVDLETGYRYSYAWTQTPLQRWELNYPVITEVEADIIRNFFDAMHGRMYHFNFDDPDLYILARQSPYSWTSPDPSYESIPNCRFDSDDLDVVYVGPGQWSTKTYVAAYLASNLQGLPS